jgi:hypothetical protein
VRGAPGRLPEAASLLQNYPNPFNPWTTIQYSLPVECHVTLRIYNVIGQEVRTLVDGMEPAGSRIVRWDAKTRQGIQASSGVYLIRLVANGGDGRSFLGLRKMMLIR